MTATLSGPAVAARIRNAFPGAVVDEQPGWVTVAAGQIVEIARFLRDDTELDCKYITSLTAVDWVDHFEIVYHLSSLARNEILVLKARADHESPVVPSVSGIWEGANLQEREVFDLMGVTFSGHPKLARVFLWEGFPGHPLRKDFLGLPGGFRPGLPRFPYEVPDGQPGYAHLAGGEASAASQAADPAGEKAP